MKRYQSITVCTFCKRTDQYEKQHPADPCPRCGSKVEEKIGRFIYNKVPWWNFWNTRGHWKVLS